MAAGCFDALYPFDVSGFQGLSIGQLRKYKQDWDTFNRIQAFNLNISTLRSQAGVGAPGATSPLQYYIYINSQEQTAYTTV